MTPQARHAAAIGVLDRWIDGTPVEKSLVNWARGARYAGSKDRAAVRDIVFQSLRCRDTYATLGKGLSGLGLVIGYVVCEGGSFPVQRPEIALKDVFDTSPYGPGVLETNLIDAVIQQCADFDEGNSDLPEWMHRYWDDSLGEGALANAMALKNRAEVFLRVNLSKMSREDALQLLEEDGIRTETVFECETALRVASNPRRITTSKAYQRGIIELQDVASQSVCRLLPVPNAGPVLDFCAGGGGKALALADRGISPIFAHDAAFERMSDLPARAARAGVQIPLLRTGDLENHAPYTMVVCDVPCSGSGSWRRSPAGKWTLTEEQLKQLLQSQSQILDNAAELLGEDGILAYITCSVFDHENQRQIDRFLRRNRSYRHRRSHQFLPTDGGDGMFVSWMQRTA